MGESEVSSGTICAWAASAPEFERRAQRRDTAGLEPAVGIQDDDRLPGRRTGVGLAEPPGQCRAFAVRAACRALEYSCTCAAGYRRSVIPAAVGDNMDLAGWSHLVHRPPKRIRQDFSFVFGQDQDDQVLPRRAMRRQRSLAARADHRRANDIRVSASGTPDKAWLGIANANPNTPAWPLRRSPAWRRPAVPSLRGSASQSAST